MKIDVLGTEYEIILAGPGENEYLDKRNADGYTDPSIRRIVVRDNAKKHRKITDQADLTVCQETTLRHEIIHAFLFESGLGCECQWHDEEAVDWVARMLPRLVNACVEAGAMG